MNVREGAPPPEDVGSIEILSTSEPDEDTPSAARGSITVAGWTVISRLTGLVRVVAVGAALGPTFFSNIFQSTNQVPNMTYEVMAGPVLALVVVPAAVRARPTGSSRSSDLLGGIAGMLTMISAGLAVVLALASPLAGLALTAGITDPAEHARAMVLAIVLVCLMAPQVVLYGLAYLGAAAQQARHRFALAAAAPAVENLVLTAVVLVVLLLHGPGVEVGTASTTIVIALGAGSTVAVAVHAALQMAGAARAGAPIRPRWGWRSDPEVMAVGVRLRRSVRVAALPAASMFGLLAVASTVPGGVTVFWLFYLLGAAPTALGARAVTTAILPSLSRAAEAGEHAEFSASWRRGLTYTALISVPALCLFVTFSGATASILAAGALSEATVTTALSAAIVVAGISQVFGSTYEIARQALFARLDTATPRLASVLGFAATIVVGASALLVTDVTMRLTILCLAVVARDLVATIVVLVRLRQVVRPEPLIDRRALAAVAVAAVAMVPALWGGRQVLTLVTPGGPAAIGVLLGAAVVAMGCFGLGLGAAARGRIGTPW